MTLKELAIRLNTSIDKIVNYYHQLSINIPNQENYDLDNDLLAKIITEHNNNSKIGSDKKDNINEIINFREIDKIEEKTAIFKGLNVKGKIELPINRYQKINIDDFLLEQYYNHSETELISEILKHNQIDKLILKGIYSPDKQNRNFGFLQDIVSLNNKILHYPYLNNKIDNLIILSTKLIKGNTYTFEAQVAKLENRKQRKNPFLLQAKSKNITEIIEYSELEFLIEQKTDYLNNLIGEKENELYRIKENLLEAEKVKIEIINRIDAEIELEKKQKLKDLQETVNSLNDSLTQQKKQIDFNNLLLNDLIKKIHLEQETLLDLNKKRSEMETTINFLRNKIEICKNLEFLTDEDANKYLNTLSSEFQFQSSEFLNFETDFKGDFYQLATHIQHYLYHRKNLIYTEFQIKNFLTLLLTNDLIVLSGLSGSGKTQIVKSFAEALGGVAKIIPVKPNWTNSDDLLGYFNPIQSSYLPTPFTEALVEAILNPNQIYLICLDEMNLARVEYYFADFLSGLEERTKQPEIDLYAKHEEELFISEFKTLLSLVESSIGATKINSWNEFLENDKIRNRFFEILGNVEKDTMLQIHSKMKKRLIDILKFPSSIKIPNNVRFIGAINVDETTHYFSPKILDRVHIVKFENPLLIEDTVNFYMENSNYEKELKPVYFNPLHFGVRQELPSISNSDYTEIVTTLKEINKNYLLPLSIDFGVRSIRQAINYVMQFTKVADNDTEGDFYKNSVIALNAIIMQKILPRFMFDGNEKTKQDEKKIDVLIKFQSYLQEKLTTIWEYELSDYETGNVSVDYLNEMIKSSNNNSQINFFN